MNHYKLLSNTRARDRAILIGLLRMGVPLQARDRRYRKARWFAIKEHEVERLVQLLAKHELCDAHWKRRYE